MAEQVSFVQACQEFFSKQPYGRKIEVSEFKLLSRQDKLELREMLIEQGYDVRELPPIAE